VVVFVVKRSIVYRDARFGGVPSCQRSKRVCRRRRRPVSPSTATPIASNRTTAAALRGPAGVDGGSTAAAVSVVVFIDWAYMASSQHGEFASFTAFACFSVLRAGNVQKHAP
jgi:hypothetical protein